MIAMRKVTLSFLYFFCKEQAEEKVKFFIVLT